MYPALELAALDLLRVTSDPAWCAIRERTVLHRMPDLLVCRVDWPEVARRRDAGQARPLSRIELVTLRELKMDRVGTFTWLSGRVPITPFHCRAALRSLVASGHVKKCGPDRYQRRTPLKPVITYMVAFEAKISDWRKAVVQARSHVLHSDKVYVVCDPSFSSRFRRAQSYFKEMQVGLLALDASSGHPRLDRLLQARKPTGSSAMLRALASEQLLPELIHRLESPAIGSRHQGVSGETCLPVATGLSESCSNMQLRT